MDIRYPQSGGPQKIDPKNKKFFFCLFKCFPTRYTYAHSIPTFTGLSKLKRKKFVRIRCVILTGSFTVNTKYALFEVDIRYLKKSIQKKKSFFLFFLEVFLDKLQLSAKHVTAFCESIYIIMHPNIEPQLKFFLFSLRKKNQKIA